MDYTFTAAHTVSAFQAQVLDYRARTGWDFLSAVRYACHPPNEASVVNGPGGRIAEVPAWDPGSGCPLDVLAEAFYLDAWDCWLFTDEADEVLGTSTQLP